MAVGDSICLARPPSPVPRMIPARIDERPYRLEEQPSGVFLYWDGAATLRITQDGTIGLDDIALNRAGKTPHRVDMGRYHALRTLLAGITDPMRIHAVNMRLLVGNES